ncbi:hypothetical protein XELAEV_18020166mg [Xenopus laevis]|uniref:Non-selective voltage-gated ion channel VDAC3 n=1 Tax=Xenopus laevis TaxID=8355 RepID=A0A974D7A7_XENLA|nr:hypothetical protein XELAEV_18020166mg [Xenopus laevis]
MAVLPTYADLGKSSRDVFNKGYGFGLVKLELKAKSSSGVTKYMMKEAGLTFTQKWNTDNILGTEVALENKGLKLSLDTTFVPNTGKKSAKLKTSYKRDYANLGIDITLDLAGPTIYGWRVLGYQGWLASYQMAFDTAKARLAQNNFALGYTAGDLQLHTNVNMMYTGDDNDGTEFGGSVYQKVSKDVGTSVSLSWSAGSSNTRFGIAAKYQLDSNTMISVGLGFELEA